MNRLAVIQNAIDRTKAAVERYGDPHPGVEEIRADDIAIGPAAYRDGRVDGWHDAAMQRIFLDVAEHHARICDLDICPECTSIAEGLTVAMSSLRWIQQRELEAALTPTSARSAWWRLRGRRP